MADKAEVIVIGMGPGGEDVAGRVAEAGLDVIGIESQLVGGECPYWGCIPSKMIIRASNLIAETRRVDGIAGTATVTPDWSPVAKRIRDEATDDWDDKVAVDRFKEKGGHFVRGEARFGSPNTVEVDGRTLTATRGIVVATGTSASIPPITGLSDTPYWTNREAIAVTELPDSLAVLGGGAIGLELAQAFARFGVNVTVIEATDRLLPAEDPESGELIAEVLRTEGLTIHVATKAQAVSHDGDAFTVSLSNGGQVTATKLLVATGRSSNLSKINAAAAGLDADAKAIKTDGKMRAAPGIWAVGDVTGEGAFTHVAMYQSRLAAADLLGQPAEPANYTALPRVTFTDPEIGSVGLSEAQASEQGLKVRIGSTKVASTARGWIHKAGNEGFIKIIADATTDKVVGATSAGPTGGEVLSMLALAVHAEVTTKTLSEMIYAYPTIYRGIEDAVRDLRA